MINPRNFVPRRSSVSLYKKYSMPGPIGKVLVVPARHSYALAVAFRQKHETVDAVQCQFVFVPIVANQPPATETPNKSHHRPTFHFRFFGHLSTCLSNTLFRAHDLARPASPPLVFPPLFAHPRPTERPAAPAWHCPRLLGGRAFSCRFRTVLPVSRHALNMPISRRVPVEHIASATHAGIVSEIMVCLFTACTAWPRRL